MMNIEDLRKAAKDLIYRDIYDLAAANDITNGHIRLYDDIDECVLLEISRSLNLVHGLGIAPIQIHISSPGGGVHHSLAMYDLIREVANLTEVKGIVEGFAASAAAMIVLQGCTWRQACKHSRLHLHELSKWTIMEQQKESDLEDTTAEMKTLQELVIDILASRTGKSKGEVLEFFRRRERWLGPKEAKEFGLIDEVLG
jgi:ATP-dependent Clp protease protease subunit